MPNRLTPNTTPLKINMENGFCWRFWCFLANGADWELGNPWHQNFRSASLSQNHQDNFRQIFHSSCSTGGELYWGCLPGERSTQSVARTLHSEELRGKRTFCTQRSFAMTVGESGAIWSNRAGAWPTSSVESVQFDFYHCDASLETIARSTNALLGRRSQSRSGEGGISWSFLIWATEYGLLAAPKPATPIRPPWSTTI